MPRSALSAAAATSGSLHYRYYDPQNPRRFYASSSSEVAGIHRAVTTSGNCLTQPLQQHQERTPSKQPLINSLTGSPHYTINETYENDPANKKRELVRGSFSLRVPVSSNLNKNSRKGGRYNQLDTRTDRAEKPEPPYPACPPPSQAPSTTKVDSSTNKENSSSNTAYSTWETTSRNTRRKKGFMGKLVKMLSRGKKMKANNNHSNHTVVHRSPPTKEGSTLVDQETPFDEPPMSETPPTATMSSVERSITTTAILLDNLQTTSHDEDDKRNNDGESVASVGSAAESLSMYSPDSPIRKNLFADPKVYTGEKGTEEKDTEDVPYLVSDLTNEALVRSKEYTMKICGLAGRFEKEEELERARRRQKQQEDSKDSNATNLREARFQKELGERLLQRRQRLEEYELDEKQCQKVLLDRKLQANQHKQQLEQYLLQSELGNQGRVQQPRNVDQPQPKLHSTLTFTCKSNHHLDDNGNRFSEVHRTQDKEEPYISDGYTSDAYASDAYTSEWEGDQDFTSATAFHLDDVDEEIDGIPESPSFLPKDSNVACKNSGEYSLKIFEHSGSTGNPAPAIQNETSDDDHKSFSAAVDDGEINFDLGGVPHGVLAPSELKTATDDGPSLCSESSNSGKEVKLPREARETVMSQALASRGNITWQNILDVRKIPEKLLKIPSDGSMDGNIAAAEYDTDAAVDTPSADGYETDAAVDSRTFDAYTTYSVRGRCIVDGYTTDGATACYTTDTGIDTSTVVTSEAVAEPDGPQQFPLPGAVRGSRRCRRRQVRREQQRKIQNIVDGRCEDPSSNIPRSIVGANFAFSGTGLPNESNRKSDFNQSGPFHADEAPSKPLLSEQQRTPDWVSKSSHESLGQEAETNEHFCDTPVSGEETHSDPPRDVAEISSTDPEVDDAAAHKSDSSVPTSVQIRRKQHPPKKISKHTEDNAAKFKVHVESSPQSADECHHVDEAAFFSSPVAKRRSLFELGLAKLSSPPDKEKQMTPSPCKTTQSPQVTAFEETSNTYVAQTQGRILSTSEVRSEGSFFALNDSSIFYSPSGVLATAKGEHSWHEARASDENIDNCVDQAPPAHKDQSAVECHGMAFASEIQSISSSSDKSDAVTEDHKHKRKNRQCSLSQATSFSKPSKPERGGIVSKKVADYEACVDWPEDVTSDRIKKTSQMEVDAQIHEAIAVVAKVQDLCAKTTSPEEEGNRKQDACEAQHIDGAQSPTEKEFAANSSALKRFSGIDKDASESHVRDGPLEWEKVKAEEHENKNIDIIEHVFKERLQEPSLDENSTARNCGNFVPVNYRKHDTAGLGLFSNHTGETSVVSNEEPLVGSRTENKKCLTTTSNTAVSTCESNLLFANDLSAIAHEPESGRIQDDCFLGSFGNDESASDEHTIPAVHPWAEVKTQSSDGTTSIQVHPGPVFGEEVEFTCSSPNDISSGDDLHALNGSVAHHDVASKDRPEHSEVRTREEELDEFFGSFDANSQGLKDGGIDDADEITGADHNDVALELEITFEESDWDVFLDNALTDILPSCAKNEFEGGFNCKDSSKSSGFGIENNSAYRIAVPEQSNSDERHVKDGNAEDTNTTEAHPTKKTANILGGGGDDCNCDCERSSDSGEPENVEIKVSSECSSPNMQHMIAALGSEEKSGGAASQCYGAPARQELVERNDSDILLGSVVSVHAQNRQERKLTSDHDTTGALPGSIDGADTTYGRLNEATCPSQATGDKEDEALDVVADKESRTDLIDIADSTDAESRGGTACSIGLLFPHNGEERDLIGYHSCGTRERDASSSNGAQMKAGLRGIDRFSAACHQTFPLENNEVLPDYTKNGGCYDASEDGIEYIDARPIFSPDNPDTMRTYSSKDEDDAEPVVCHDEKLEICRSPESKDKTQEAIIPFNITTEIVEQNDSNSDEPNGTIPRAECLLNKTGGRRTPEFSDVKGRQCCIQDEELQITAHYERSCETGKLELAINAGLNIDIPCFEELEPREFLNRVLDVHERLRRLDTVDCPDRNGQKCTSPDENNTDTCKTPNVFLENKVPGATIKEELIKQVQQGLRSLRTTFSDADEDVAGLVLGAENQLNALENRQAPLTHVIQSEISPDLTKEVGDASESNDSRGSFPAVPLLDDTLRQVAEEDVSPNRPIYRDHKITESLHRYVSPSHIRGDNDTVPEKKLCEARYSKDEGSKLNIDRVMSEGNDKADVTTAGRDSIRVHFNKRARVERETIETVLRRQKQRMCLAGTEKTDLKRQHASFLRMEARQSNQFESGGVSVKIPPSIYGRNYFVCESFKNLEVASHISLKSDVSQQQEQKKAVAFASFSPALLTEDIRESQRSELFQTHNAPTKRSHAKNETPTFSTGKACSEFPRKLVDLKTRLSNDTQLADNPEDGVHSLCGSLREDPVSVPEARPGQGLKTVNSMEGSEQNCSSDTAGLLTDLADFKTRIHKSTGDGNIDVSRNMSNDESTADFLCETEGTRSRGAQPGSEPEDDNSPDSSKLSLESNRFQEELYRLKTKLQSKKSVNGLQSRKISGMLSAKPSTVESKKLMEKRKQKFQLEKRCESENYRQFNAQKGDGDYTADVTRRLDWSQHSDTALKNRGDGSTSTKGQISETGKTAGLICEMVGKWENRIRSEGTYSAEKEWARRPYLVSGAEALLKEQRRRKQKVNLVGRQDSPLGKKNELKGHDLFLCPESLAAVLHEGENGRLNYTRFEPNSGATDTIEAPNSLDLRNEQSEWESLAPAKPDSCKKLTENEGLNPGEEMAANEALISETTSSQETEDVKDERNQEDATTSTSAFDDAEFQESSHYNDVPADVHQELSQTPVLSFANKWSSKFRLTEEQKERLDGDFTRIRRMRQLAASDSFQERDTIDTGKPSSFRRRLASQPAEILEQLANKANVVAQLGSFPPSDEFIFLSVRSRVATYENCTKSVQVRPPENAGTHSPWDKDHKAEGIPTGKQSLSFCCSEIMISRRETLLVSDTNVVAKGGSCDVATLCVEHTGTYGESEQASDIQSDYYDGPAYDEDQDDEGQWNGRYNDVHHLNDGYVSYAEEGRIDGSESAVTNENEESVAFTLVQSVNSSSSKSSSVETKDTFVRSPLLENDFYADHMTDCKRTLESPRARSRSQNHRPQAMARDGNYKANLGVINKSAAIVYPRVDDFQKDTDCSIATADGGNYESVTFTTLRPLYTSLSMPPSVETRCTYFRSSLLQNDFYANEDPDCDTDVEGFNLRTEESDTSIIGPNLPNVVTGTTTNRLLVDDENSFDDATPFRGCDGDSYEHSLSDSQAVPPQEEDVSSTMSATAVESPPLRIASFKISNDGGSIYVPSAHDGECSAGILSGSSSESVPLVPSSWGKIASFRISNDDGSVYVPSGIDGSSTPLLAAENYDAGAQDEQGSGNDEGTTSDVEAVKNEDVDESLIFTDDSEEIAMRLATANLNELIGPLLENPEDAMSKTEALEFIKDLSRAMLLDSEVDEEGVEVNMEQILDNDDNSILSDKASKPDPPTNQALPKDLLSDPEDPLPIEATFSVFREAIAGVTDSLSSWHLPTIFHEDSQLASIDEKISQKQDASQELRPAETTLGAVLSQKKSTSPNDSSGTQAEPDTRAIANADVAESSKVSRDERQLPSQQVDSDDPHQQENRKESLGSQAEDRGSTTEYTGTSRVPSPAIPETSSTYHFAAKTVEKTNTSTKYRSTTMTPFIAKKNNAADSPPLHPHTFNARTRTITPTPLETVRNEAGQRRKDKLLLRDENVPNGESPCTVTDHPSHSEEAALQRSNISYGDPLQYVRANKERNAKRSLSSASSPPTLQKSKSEKKIPVDGNIFSVQTDICRSKSSDVADNTMLCRTRLEI